MVNYTTDLKTWGASGVEYPDGYSYVEGEQPVDGWDNYVIANIIDDIQHLVDVTNNTLATVSYVDGEISNLDSDGDGKVDSAESADNATSANVADTANLYKNNDIDSDGDGKVDDADHADNADNATQADNADKLDGEQIGSVKNKYIYENVQESGSPKTVTILDRNINGGLLDQMFMEAHASDSDGSQEIRMTATFTLDDGSTETYTQYARAYSDDYEETTTQTVTNLSFTPHLNGRVIENVTVTYDAWDGDGIADGMVRLHIKEGYVPA